MPSVQKIYVIYNPNSTGDSKSNADQFVRDAAKQSLTVEAVATKHPGHAQELAKQFAQTATQVMIVSSSGDGGYNEVINGILSSKNPQAIAGVLPSGNANDHYHSLHQGDTIDNIKKGHIRTIDVLKVATANWSRFAHSYVGIGLTPQIGKELTANQLTVVTESWLVLKHLFSLRPVRIRIDGHIQEYDSLVFSNTPRMSKFLTLSTEAKIDDGLMEISKVKSGTFMGLWQHIFKAAVNAIDTAPQAKQSTFTCLRNMNMQLDGEIVTCKSGDTVTVSSQPQRLRCIV